MNSDYFIVLLQCTACPSGWVCENGIGKPCSAVSSDLGLIEVDGVCETCPAGYECRNGLSYACPAGTHVLLDFLPQLKSDSGTWGPGGSFRGECINCLPGTFSNHSAATVCETCPAGRMSSHGNTACSDCIPGEYSQAGEPCETCPVGTYSSAASRNCTVCPSGRTSAAGSRECVDQS